MPVSPAHSLLGLEAGGWALLFAIPPAEPQKSERLGYLTQAEWWGLLFFIQEVGHVSSSQFAESSGEPG